MGWNQRIREAAYTAPDGTRIAFDYENVSHAVDKRTTGFNFPDAPGTYVQDMGHTGRRYPMRLFFWGENYDTESDAFEALLLQSGVGRLEHPIYGVVNVVPFGTITRRDDLKTAANQAVIEVTFWETIETVYPSSQGSPGADVLAGVAVTNKKIAEQFSDAIDFDSAIERISFKNDYTAMLATVREGTQKIADTQDDVRKQFNAINDSINQGIDTLISDPLTLAFQTILLIQAPARAALDIKARLNAYGDLLTSILSGKGANVGTSNDSRRDNQIRNVDLFTMSVVVGGIVAVVNNKFIRKSDALSAAEDLISMFDEHIAWRDVAIPDDTGEAYQAFQDTVSKAIGFLVEISFTLKAERRITLDRARTIIDLSAELYSDIDGSLDDLINNNDLSGSEIIELPRGRTIVYYL